ncbi:MAG TPA: class IV adenylate cyclase [Tepidisphaeraceae bacterium]|jgi:adenylate cyclase class 2
MSVEIEAKMKVDSLEETVAKLKTVGGERIGDFEEVNSFFDSEDRSLLAADEGLRLRVAKNSDTQAEKYVLTFKGPRLHGKLKSREERELDVGNAKDAERFLNALGFKKVLAFEKKRTKWKLGGCSIELDTLPHLGTFVEIEGPDEETVLRVRTQLGLDRAPIIKSSYIAMLMAYLQDQNRPDRIVTFNDKK